jgi:transcriptional regulator with XRE-family HTH domain
MIGLRISALRRSAGWSQADLAQRLKISASAVGMYEQGRREPSLQMLIELSELFGVTIDYLVTGKPNTQHDKDQFSGALHGSVAAVEKQLLNRKEMPFSRQELTVLLAALLMEP